MILQLREQCFIPPSPKCSVFQVVTDPIFQSGAYTILRQEIDEFLLCDGFKCTAGVVVDDVGTMLFIQQTCPLVLSVE